jgi:hypothetical protein
MKLATVYRRSGKYLLNSSSQATSGVWIGKVFRVLPTSASDESLGRDVLAALQLSRTGIAHPDPKDWAAIQQPLLDAAGVRRWSQFVKGSDMVTVRLGDGVIEVTPERRVAGEEGLEEVPEKMMRIDDGVSPEELGKLVKQALDSQRV